MGRLLVFVLGAAVLFGVAYHYLEGSGRPDGEAPEKALQHAREAADRIEDDAARRVEELLEKTR
jgi:hypothetical protein